MKKKLFFLVFLIEHVIIEGSKLRHHSSILLSAIHTEFNPVCVSNPEHFFSVILFENTDLYHSLTLSATFTSLKNNSITFTSSCFFKGLGIECKSVKELDSQSSFYNLTSIQDSLGEYTFEVEDSAKNVSVCVQDICLIPINRGIINLVNNPRFSLIFDQSLRKVRKPDIYIKGGGKIKCEIDENDEEILNCQPKKEDLPPNANISYSLDLLINQCGVNITTGIGIDPRGLFEFYIKSVKYTPRCFTYKEHFHSIITLESNTEKIYYGLETKNTKRIVTFRSVDNENISFSLQCDLIRNTIDCQSPDTVTMFHAYRIDTISENEKNEIYYDDRSESTCHSNSCLSDQQINSQSLVYQESDLEFFMFFRTFTDFFPPVIVNNNEINCIKDDSLPSKKKIKALTGIHCKPTIDQLKGKKGVLLKQADVYVVQCYSRYRSSVKLAISTLISSSFRYFITLNSYLLIAVIF